ncbi:MAG: transposase family protein [Trichodesmium sp. ALOHA_ZT_67]|nr:transposase family protein [Trichodesmium sp. ALOHA_ZT_67]
MLGICFGVSESTANNIFYLVDRYITRVTA